MRTDLPVTGALQQYLTMCEANGWNPAADIRMEEGGGQLSDDDQASLDALSDDERTALAAMSDDDIGALSELTDEQLAALAGGEPAEDGRVKRLKNEAARRRKELQPWKALAAEFDVTPESLREMLEAAENDDDDADGKGGKGRKPKAPRRDRSVEERANQKLVRAEVKAAAADSFADPADAALYLDLSKYELDEDGELVDPDELDDDLQDLLERKPHLAKARERKGPKPLPGQGRREAKQSTGLDAGAERARAKFGTSKNGE